MYKLLIVLLMIPMTFAQTAGPQQTRELTDQVAAADAALFAAFFDRCDIDTLKTMVTDDLEMFHDKNGLVATSGKQFIDNMASTCAHQKKGDAYRARRELVPGTLKVYPLNNYGAVETGEHRFYQLLPGKPEKLVEVSLFTHVWKKEASGWKLARAVSYAHSLTE